MTGSADSGSADISTITQKFYEMSRLAQEAESMLPGFDRQMRVARDATAAAQLAEAHGQFKAVQSALEQTWAQIEPTIKNVLEAHPEISPPA